MTGSYRRGIFGVPVMPSPGQTPPAETSAPVYQPLSTGRMIAGGIGDALLQWAGGRPVFAPMMQQRQQNAMQLAAEQRQRAAGFADWRAKQEWERANPAAPQPTEFERTVRAAGFTPGTPEYAQIMKTRAVNQADPVRAVPGFDAQGNEVLRFMRPGGTAAPAAGPPPGVTFTPLPKSGGAGQSGPRTFPIR